MCRARTVAIKFYEEHKIEISEMLLKDKKLHQKVMGVLKHICNTWRFDKAYAAKLQNIYYKLGNGSYFTCTTLNTLKIKKLSLQWYESRLNETCLRVHQHHSFISI